MSRWLRRSPNWWSWWRCPAIVSLSLCAECARSLSQASPSCEVGREKRKSSNVAMHFFLLYSRSHVFFCIFRVLSLWQCQWRTRWNALSVFTFVYFKYFSPYISGNSTATFVISHFFFFYSHLILFRISLPSFLFLRDLKKKKISGEMDVRWNGEKLISGDYTGFWKNEKKKKAQPVIRCVRIRTAFFMGGGLFSAHLSAQKIRPSPKNSRKWNYKMSGRYR